MDKSCFRFKDTKRFSPVIYGNDLPWEYDLFHTPINKIPKTEKQYKEFLLDEHIRTDFRWWREQKRRCVEGYMVKDAIEFGKGDSYIEGRDYKILDNGNIYLWNLGLEIQDTDIWISGRFYFYLNFFKIRAIPLESEGKSKRKIITNPRFTDLDFDYWHVRERMIKEGKDLQNQKSRQKGVSFKCGCDVTFEYTFFNNSQSVIVSGEEKYSMNTMKYVINGLNELRNTQFWKWRSRAGDSKDYIQSKYTGSEIYMRTAKDNPEAVSSLSPSLIIFEETGIWKTGLLKETYNFVKPSLVAEGEKTGYAIFLGTGGDADKGVVTAQEMFFDPATNGLLEFEFVFDEMSAVKEGVKTSNFIPAYKYELIDNDGNSLIEDSIKKLKEEREKTEPKDRFRLMTQKPFNPEESFMISTAGYFGEVLINKLNERKIYLMTHKEEQIGFYCDLEWVDAEDFSKGVTMSINPEGSFYIMQRPEYDVDGNVIEGLYKAATDSYDRDEANTSTSKGSIHIMKGYYLPGKTANHWVARCMARPSEEEGGSAKFYEMTAKLCMYYGEAINLIEYSNLKIFQWYEDNRLEYLLKPRPQVILSNWIENSTLSNRYGIDPSTKLFWLETLKQYLINNNFAAIDRMYDLEQIEAFIKYRYETGNKRYNCDITISSALSVVLLEDEKEMIININKKNKEDFFIGYKRKKGRIGQITY